MEKNLKSLLVDIHKRKIKYAQEEKNKIENNQIKP